MLFSELKPIYCADCDAPLRKGEGHTQRDKRIVCDKCQTRIERKREGARQRDLFVEQSSLFNPVITRRRNIEGYTDETGFHPIRASKDYNEFLAGDFEPRERKLTKKQQRELDEWHKREEEQVREDMLLSGIPKKTLAQYVRAIGGIVPGGAYAGEIRRLSYKETGTTGLINQKARQGALKQSAEFVMDSANEEGYRDRNGERFTSIGDFLSAVEESAIKGIDHFRARGMTAKQSRDKRLKKAMASNPQKRSNYKMRAYNRATAKWESRIAYNVTKPQALAQAFNEFPKRRNYTGHEVIVIKNNPHSSLSRDKRLKKAMAHNPTKHLARPFVISGRYVIAQLTQDRPENKIVGRLLSPSGGFYPVGPRGQSFKLFNTVEGAKRWARKMVAEFSERAEGKKNKTNPHSSFHALRAVGKLPNPTRRQIEAAIKRKRGEADRLIALVKRREGITDKVQYATYGSDNVILVDTAIKLQDEANRLESKLEKNNPHSSFHALSAARSKKAARVEAKGRAIVSAGAKRKDAALMQKGARLAKRGLSSGEGHTLKGGTHTEGPVGRLPNPIDWGSIVSFNFTYAIPGGAWLKDSHGYHNWYTFTEIKKHLGESWVNAALRKQGQFTGVEVDVSRLKKNPGFLSRVRGNLKREKVARKLAGVQGRIKAATDSLREYDTDSMWDDVPKAKKRGKAKAKAHLDDLKQLEKELIADFRAVKNPAMKGEYVVEWWKWPNKKPAGAKYFTNIGEALDFADKKQDSADPVIVYRWSSDRWVRVAGAQPPGWTGIDPQYRKNPGNDSVHIDAGHVTVVGKAKRMSTQNPKRDKFFLVEVSLKSNDGQFHMARKPIIAANGVEARQEAIESLLIHGGEKKTRGTGVTGSGIEFKIGKAVEVPKATYQTARERWGYRRSNPDSVNAIAEEFQGKASGAVVEQYAASSAPKNLARAGRLVFLKLAKGHTMRIPGAMVAIGPNKRLWITGDHAPLFTTKAKRGEGLDLGEVAAICYETAKKHIGDGKRFEYVHKFGEDGGRRPRLVVDSEGMPILRGGDYQVKAEGIVN